jgi:microcin C transport system permease protein
MIPAFIGITLIAFVIINLVPGGPLERELMKQKHGSGQSSESAHGLPSGSSYNIPESALKELREYYEFDKPLHLRYLNWLKNTLTLNLGKSYVYSEPVWDVISKRFPVSVYFGVLGFIITYLVSVPLGVLKAIKNGTGFDFFSSVIILVGYAVPGWTFGVLMLIFFGGGSFLDLFPLGGFHSPEFVHLSLSGKILDVLHHTFLPVFAYVAGNFASLTILTKNSVLDTLGKDYIRTAYAKGLPGRKVFFSHALRNSLIPVSTGIGSFLNVLLAGSFIIEKVFNIDGIGMLGYNSLINRDYPTSMGLLVITGVLLMLGNIISDIIYAYADPRVRFN